jgi:ABC-type glycerol-3-phosphate transport system substrate-binding protein
MSTLARLELPLIAIAVGTLLAGWWAYNRFVANIYPPDPSENGRFTVIRYGTDVNPARNEQVGIFNRYHLPEHLKAQYVPGASGMQNVVTASAAGNAPDIVDVFNPEDLRALIDKGIARPLNPYLKAAGIDLAALSWPTRLGEMRRDNPAWHAGDDPREKYVYYGVPNNVSTDMVWFNRTLYEQVREERRRAGESMPPEPWLHWTWWDYAALGHALQRKEGTTFVSFGATEPDVETLMLQIGLSERGEDPARFATLTADERRRLGIAGLSWDDCVRIFAPSADGVGTGLVNRGALAQALQYRYDLIHVLQGAPSPSDANQMETSGGFAGGGNFGQFKAGRLGLFICGRWFIGQVRADVGFDWRLVRMPRWVPYDQWRGWQQRNLAPADRDGDWGERDHPLRGFGLYLGGRVAILSSSSRHPEEAFRFLAFLVQNPDYNQALLIEDGMGANLAMTRAYLAHSDPLFPREIANRTPEHELGTLANLFAKDAWPHANAGTGRTLLWANADADLNRGDLLATALAADPRRIPYDAAVGDMSATAAVSTPAVGEELARRTVATLDSQLAIGEAIDHPGRSPFTPFAIAVLIYAACAVAIARWKAT